MTQPTLPGRLSDPNNVLKTDPRMVAALSPSEMVVVGVELNDCMSELRWTFDNKSSLGISKIVISGESGGGNLSLAVTLKAAKEGTRELIDGTYQCVPLSPTPTLRDLGHFLLSTRMTTC